MNRRERERIILRIERAALVLRWLALVLALASAGLGGLPWNWAGLIPATVIVLGHNGFAHLALYRRRADWFASASNYTLYLAEATLIVFLTGADDSVAFILYPLFLLGLSAYTSGTRILLASTLLCIALFGGALAVEYFTAGISRPWGELLVKALAIGGTGWVVGVLSNQLQRNATESMRHAEALASSEATLRTVLNTAADIILIVDDNDRITDANERACSLLRLERDEILGQRPRAFFFDDGTLGVKLASLRAHGEYRGEMIVVDADSHEHTVDMLIRTFLRNGERFQVVMAQDITEKKELEEATRLANENLAQLNRELRQVDQMKREFFNTVSVRMRSPVAAILGYADMLLADELGELSPEQRKAVQTCRRSAQRLLEMVDDAIEIGSHQPPGIAETAATKPPRHDAG